MYRTPRFPALPAERNRDIARSPLRNLLSKYRVLDAISNLKPEVINNFSDLIYIQPAVQPLAEEVAFIYLRTPRPWLKIRWMISKFHSDVLHEILDILSDAIVCTDYVLLHTSSRPILTVSEQKVASGVTFECIRARRHVLLMLQQKFQVFAPMSVHPASFPAKPVSTNSQIPSPDPEQVAYYSRKPLPPHPARKLCRGKITHHEVKSKEFPEKELPFDLQQDHAAVANVQSAVAVGERPIDAVMHSRASTASPNEAPMSMTNRTPSRSVALRQALQKANHAVTLDQHSNQEGAIQAYQEACALLQKVMIRSSGVEDRSKVDAVQNAYKARIVELLCNDQSYKGVDGKTLHERDFRDSERLSIVTDTDEGGGLHERYFRDSERLSIVTDTDEGGGLHERDFRDSERLSIVTDTDEGGGVVEPATAAPLRYGQNGQAQEARQPHLEMLGNRSSIWHLASSFYHMVNAMVEESWRFQHAVSRFTRYTGLVDPQLQDGKVRIKWRCKCGQKLYDDYIEQRPGAAVELEKLLNGNNEHAPASGREHSSRGDLDRWSSSTLQSMRASHEHLQTAAKAKLKPSSRAYDPRPKEGEEATTVIDCDPESRWLLVCAKAQERPTSLSHLDICSTSTDKELFENLRKAYLTLKSKWSHWFSLRRVQSIRFVQFELHIKDFVDIRKVPDMPPENKRDEYLYQPCELIPPVGENLMAHLFHHPEDANERSITFLRAPKKRKAKLTIYPQRGTSVGWGIHLVKGWVMSRLWLLSLAMFVLGSLVFGICWAVLRHDVQGAFGVAAYMVALVGLVVGTIQAGLS